MSGWFAVKRGITSHPIFKKRPDRAFVWLWMLETAAYKDTRQDAGGKPVAVKRGQVLTSFRQIEAATGVGIQVVRTLFKLLEDEHAINTDTSNGRLLVTICNYDKYQSSKDDSNTPANTAPTQRQHTKEQGNKGTSKEEAKASLSDKPTVGGPSFDKFWEIWPLGKIAKKNAAKAFKKLNAQERTLATERAPAWAAQWRRDHPHANPIHPASYLNGTRWTDEIQPTLTVIHGGPREHSPQHSRVHSGAHASDRAIAFASRAVRTPSKDCF